MAKQKGHRANKANDSFGTINNDQLYRGKYRDEVYEDEEEVVEAEGPSSENEEATPEAQENTTAFAEPAEGSNTDYKKRYDDLKRHYDSKLEEWKREREEIQNAQQVGAQEGVPQADLPTTPDELVEFREKYPDVYKVVETISTIQAESRLKELKSEVEVLKGREQKAQSQAAYQQLLNQHPDFPKLKTDEKFLMWLDEQPETISDGIYKNNSDVKWASRVLDLYKADMGISSKKSKKLSDVDAALSVGKSTAKDVVKEVNPDKKIWKASEIGRLKPWEFEKVEAELDAARAEGRINYQQ
jgi:hypothetical protein